MTTRLLLGVLLLAACRRDSTTLQGETDAKQVNVATKVPGRVDSLFVREGDSVRRGQIVATLDGPEIRAKAAQALAARDAARAIRDKARNGSREEDVRAARNNWLRAVASATIAETTYARLDRLQREGVVPVQKRDEAEASLRASREGAEAAKAQYDLATAGARSEDRTAAFADLRRAEGAVAEAESYVSENELRSAVNGQVLLKIVEQGELVSPGQPVVTIVDLTDQWITLNLREDRLAGLRIGDTLLATIPAVDSAVHPFAVYYISPLGAFATWRATREAGGFDVRTFEVRARPTQPLAALRPGMSALVQLAHESASVSGLTAVVRRELRRLRGLPDALGAAGPHPGGDDPVARGRVRIRGGSRPAGGRARSRPERNLARRFPLGRGHPRRASWPATSRIWVPRGRPCSSGRCTACWSSRVTSSATSSGVVHPTSRSSTTRSISRRAATCRPTCPGERRRRRRCLRPSAAGSPRRSGWTCGRCSIPRRATLRPWGSS